jgi:hypothetical protein
MYLSRLAGFIFFGLADLSSSARWIYLLRVIIGLLLYNITRCVSGSMDSSSMVNIGIIFFGSMDSSSMVSADSSSMVITGFFGSMDSSSMISADSSSIYDGVIFNMDSSQVLHLGLHLQYFILNGLLSATRIILGGSTTTLPPVTTVTRRLSNNHDITPAVLGGSAISSSTIWWYPLSLIRCFYFRSTFSLHSKTSSRIDSIVPNKLSVPLFHIKLIII